MRATFLLACGFWLLAFPSTLLAQPSQEDVLRSIGQNLDRETADASKLLALLAAAAGLAILLVLLGQRRKRAVAPRGLHHHGKLLKEMSKAISLKTRELRQIKLLADEQGLESPLTLLLCPGLLERAARDTSPRVDRASLSALMRKLARNGA